MATDTIKVEVTSFSDGFTKELAKAVAASMKKALHETAKPGGGKSPLKTDANDKASKASANAMKNVFAVVKGAGKTLGTVVIVAKLVIKAIETLTAGLETTSKQLVARSTLFTDKGIMDLMQRTGQDATGATATQRSLDALGLSLEDIQSGKVTSAQMAAFEAIREKELERLQAVAAVSGPMMESWQNMALNLGTASRQFMDNLTIVLAKTGKIPELASKLEAVISDAYNRTANIVGPLVNAVFSVIIPLLDTIMTVVDVIWPVVEMIVNVISQLGSLIGNILEKINPIIGYLKGIFAFFAKAIGAGIDRLFSIINFIMPVLDVVFAVIEGIVAVIAKVFDAFSFVNEFFAGLEEKLQNLFPWLASKNAEDSAAASIVPSVTYNNGNNSTVTYNTTTNNNLSNNLLANSWAFANN